LISFSKIYIKPTLNWQNRISHGKDTKERFTHQNMPGMQTAFYLAKKMGKSLA
jgi:hypothetical protein